MDIPIHIPVLDLLEEFIVINIEVIEVKKLTLSSFVESPKSI